MRRFHRSHHLLADRSRAQAVATGRAIAFTRTSPHPALRLALVSALALLALGILASGALAQTPQPQQPQPQQPMPPTQQQEPAPEQIRLQQIQQRLGAVQQAAMEANPELQEQQAEFEELVVETMQEHGYQPEATMDTLETLQQEIQQPDLSERDRQNMMLQARQAQQRLQEAQNMALQDSQVVAVQTAFREDLVEAMKDEEPATEELIVEFEQLQQQLMGGMPAPGGDR